MSKLDAVKAIRVTDTESFKRKAAIVHGNKYIYLQSVYTRSHDHVKIICPYHGEFFCTPSNHLKAKGCRVCANQLMRERFAGTLENFIAKAKAVHGDLYDYSKSRYVNGNSPVEIVCPKHGSFFQTPNNHTYHKQKCGACSGVGLTFKETLKKIKRKARYSDKVDYSNASLANGRLFGLACKIHGSVFDQLVGNHIKNFGCPACKLERRSRDWSQISARGLLGFYGTSEESNLYILKCRDIPVIKVGLAKDIATRIQAIKNESGMDWLLEKRYTGKAKDLWRVEQAIHKSFPSFDHKVKFAGWTEVYSDAYFDEIDSEICRVHKSIGLQCAFDFHHNQNCMVD